MNQAEFEAQQEFHKNEMDTKSPELPCVECGKDSDAWCELVDTNEWLCEKCDGEMENGKRDLTRDEVIQLENLRLSPFSKYAGNVS